MPRRFGWQSLHSLKVADALAQRYGCRPSDLLKVDDPYQAWCIDEAAAIAGMGITQSSANAPSQHTQKKAPVRMVDGMPLITGPIERL